MPHVRRTTGQILGEKLAHYRGNAGLTQEELSDRLLELGHTMNRVTIAKIESAGRPGARKDATIRADNASLIDVLMLAAALDVPPVLLWVPLGDDEELEIGGQRVHPHLMLDWVAGDDTLRCLPRNQPVGTRHRWKENAEVVELFRDLRRFQNRAEHAQAVVTTIEHDGQPDEVRRAHAVLDVRLRDLGQHLRTMENAGIRSLPRFPSSWRARIAELQLEDDR